MARETLPLVTAAVAPVVTDDKTKGHRLGQFWLDTVSTTLYRCVDVTTGAAVWINTEAAAGSQAEDIVFDPAGTLASTDAQAALEELDSDIQGHIADGTDAHAASAITNTPAGAVAATTVQGAINELDSDLTTVANNLAAHLADGTDAHAASAITNTPAGTIAATTAQAAINELDGDIQAHLADGTGAHAASAISFVPAVPLVAINAQTAIEELNDDPALTTFKHTSFV